ncbi:MAG: inositol monophosphatase [Desulfobacter sp.]|nr:MAG: inositol monophosphatase [Desulfobacter sp.]
MPQASNDKKNGRHLIPFIKQLAKTAGQICLEGRAQLTTADLTFKSPKDLVTATDKAVEGFLVKEIRTAFPDHAIIGEETGTTAGTGEYRWIIDPIDGTTSFVHEQPFYAVSIGLEKEGKRVAGIVYAPVLDQMFWAETGRGAFLNGRPIGVSTTRKLTDAVMATGFACLRSGMADNNLPHFNRIVPQLRDIRRYGSAALDLCYTACGRLDGYWEMNLNLYDIAAGVVILEEAGGKVSDFAGANNYPEKGIVAANPHLHGQLITCLNPKQ